MHKSHILLTESPAPLSGGVRTALKAAAFGLRAYLVLSTTYFHFSPPVVLLRTKSRLASVVGVMTREAFGSGGALQHEAKYTIRVHRSKCIDSEKLSKDTFWVRTYLVRSRSPAVVGWCGYTRSERRSCSSNPTVVVKFLIYLQEKDGQQLLLRAPGNVVGWRDSTAVDEGSIK